MEITKARLRELKSQIQIKKPLGQLLQESLVVGGPKKSMRLKAAAEDPDSQPFGFDIKILKVEGYINKKGILDYAGSVVGVQIAHKTIDVSNHEVCTNPSLGKLVGVRYCFYMKGNCLYTKGTIKGWFKDRTSWNQKIVCF